MFAHPKAAELKLSSALDFKCVHAQVDGSVCFGCPCSRCSLLPVPAARLSYLATLEVEDVEELFEEVNESLKVRSAAPPPAALLRPLYLALAPLQLCYLFLLSQPLFLSKVVGFTDDESLGCYQVLAAILHLGNVEFDAAVSAPESVASNEGAPLAFIPCSVILWKNPLHRNHTTTPPFQNNDAPAELSKDGKALAQFAASLLGVNADDFTEALTCSTTVTRGEVIDHLHNKSEALGRRPFPCACLVFYYSSSSLSSTHRPTFTTYPITDTRDATAKALYGKMFGWLVSRINVLLTDPKMRSAATQSIGTPVALAPTPPPCSPALVGC